MTHLKKEVNPIAPSNNKRWTKKDDQILRQMVKEKATTSEVAIALGRTKSAIWGRKYELDVDGRLSSSKGKGIVAPTTIGTKNRLGSETKREIKQEASPAIKAKRGRKPGSKSVKTSTQNLDFAQLSLLAKASGAKIVITFE